MKRKLSGEELFKRLEAKRIEPEYLTESERQRVTEYHQRKQKELRKKLKKREERGLRTRFGLGSWLLPTEKSIMGIIKRRKKKIRM